MSNFDVLIGVGESSVNNALKALYANSTLRQSIFTGSKTETIDGQGEVSLNYDVLAAPTVSLSSPSESVWNAAIKQSASTTLPSTNVLQLHFSSIKGDETLAGSAPVSAQGVLDVILSVSLTNNQLSFDPLAVSLDTSSFSAFDAWFVTQLLAPAALTLAADALKSMQLPALPSYQNVSFNAPALLILQDQLLTATTLTTTSIALSFDGFTVPDKHYYALVHPRAIDAIGEAAASTYVGHKQTGSKKEGNDMAWAEGSYEASLKSISVDANTQDPTKIAVSVSASISASGSAGGIGPALACPVGAALNAF
ncbi:MAG: hypothetical protein OXE99_10010 [Cellvibrionales bacterium]|nr:hypothetical protein [Cellvibrionales bacterium]